jgi:hypothetical protein
MTETVEVDTVDGDAREERGKISKNHPICVIKDHDQGHKVDEMIDQNIWRPNMPFAVNEDGTMQYQSREGAYQGRNDMIHDD